MKAKLLINGKEIEVNISEEEYKKIQPVEEKKTGYERVSKNNEYYCDATKGIVGFGTEEQHYIDDEYYESANYYSSRVVAENNARADNLMRQLRRFAVEHRGNEIDWYDTETIKYWIVYNPATSNLKVGKGCLLQSFGNIYFDSEESTEAAIGEFHDELIWYFTEYKDSL